MDQTTKATLKVWFTFTLQLQREPGCSSSGIFQRAGEPICITMNDVPDKDLVGTYPSQRVLWQIEATFLDALSDLYPTFDVINWEARAHKVDGPPLSKFRNFLPGNQD